MARIKTEVMRSDNGLKYSVVRCEHVTDDVVQTAIALISLDLPKGACSLSTDGRPVALLKAPCPKDNSECERWAMEAGEKLASNLGLGLPVYLIRESIYDPKPSRTGATTTPLELLGEHTVKMEALSVDGDRIIDPAAPADAPPRVNDTFSWNATLWPDDALLPFEAGVEYDRAGGAVECPPHEPMAAPAQPPIEPDKTHPEPARIENQRKYARIRTGMVACIRHPDLGEEIVTTEDISRGGFRIRSARLYSVGALVDVAVPYARDGVNIFVVARIAHGHGLPDRNWHRYGLAYIPRKS